MRKEAFWRERQLSLDGIIVLAAVSLVACGTNSEDAENPPTVTYKKPNVGYAAKRGSTIALSEMSFDRGLAMQRTKEPRAPLTPVLKTSGIPRMDPLAQRELQISSMPTPETNFDGNSSDDNAAQLGLEVLPPDTTGDVGPNHYVQWVNLVFSVYDKQGNRLFGPAPGNLPWQGFGGICETNNDGDIMVVYDQLADRWVFSQFAVGPDGHQCFAVSKTPDPLGPYNLYDFVVAPGGLNDYPKLAVWPDGYFGTYNLFDRSGGGFQFNAAVAVVYERAKMLEGLNAAFATFPVKDPAGIETYFALQPAHLEGRLAPEPGTPHPFVMAFDDEVWGQGGTPTTDSYRFWELAVDWTDPNASTLTGPFAVTTEDFDAELCGFSRNCIPQPDGAPRLDTLGQFTMYRTPFRKLPGYDAMVVTHTVDVDGNSTSGVRWAEIRNPGPNATVHQSGTYAPTDGDFRWMPTGAMDSAGNIAVGFSASSTTTYPSMRYAGRLANDPLGLLAQGEVEVVAGTGSQNNASGRWADYATMSVDESDDCTFWYTHEYVAEGTLWSTRIASFRYPTCVATAVGEIRGTVIAATGEPLPGAVVSTGTFTATTDANGAFSLLVPIGAYDIEVTAFGFETETRLDVVVNDGDVVTLNFSLQSAPKVAVEGFAYDKEAGWPLYARISISSASGPSQTVFTNPVTGYYIIELLSGTEYTFDVASQIRGYLGRTRPVTAGPGDQVVNFALDVNTGTCDAPGYMRRERLLNTADFEGAFPPTGWKLDNATAVCGTSLDFTNVDVRNRTNLTGGEGLFAIADSDACGVGAEMDASLVSPTLDLSRLGPQDGLLVRFSHDYRHLGQSAGTLDLLVGEAWVNLLTFNRDDRGPKRIEVGSDAANGQGLSQVRFRYTAGWDWWWQLDDVELVAASCEYIGGGLIVGEVTDENTSLFLAEATVSVEGGDSEVTFATEEDENVGDGFFAVFVPGAREITVTRPNYGPATALAIPQFNGVRRLDFSLPAGQLRISPLQVYARASFGETDVESLVLDNIGGFEAGFSLRALEGPPSRRPERQVGPLPRGRRTSPKQIDALTAAAARVPFEQPVVPLLNAGEVTRRFGTVTGAWGLGYDTDGNDLWIGSVSALPDGDDRLYRTLPDGTLTDDTIDATYTAVFAADMAFNSRTSTFWHVNVGGDNCIHEVDPAAQAPTGNSICPAFGTSERGLAYDPVTDTFFAGSWNDGVINQFDASGTILRAVSVGLDISGLAYNPATQHLFALTNGAATNQDVFVLDTTANFDIIGSFEFTDNGAPAFSDFGQAALALDCDGNLWAVNQAAREVLVASSGEATNCQSGLEWLTFTPEEGIVPAQSTGVINLNVSGTRVSDGGLLLPGQRQAQVLLTTDTPYEVSTVSVFFTLAFRDVSASDPDEAYVHALSTAGVTRGCGGGNFCPDEGMRRDQLAEWLLHAIEGEDYRPPRATGLIFDDVPPWIPFADYIEEVARRGISGGCGGRNFCPTQVLRREESAVFVLRALEGEDYTPPPGEGIFDDVPDDPFRPWIEELARRGIATTCGPNRFCPRAATIRSQMAVFLVRGFEFPVFFTP